VAGKTLTVTLRVIVLVHAFNSLDYLWLSTSGTLECDMKVGVTPVSSVRPQPIDAARATILARARWRTPFGHRKVFSAARWG
jgi:hypothetical protein